KFLRPGPGYGGSCFPKDTLALVRAARLASSPLRLIETVVDVNEWRKAAMARRVIAACDGAIAGKIVAALGLTFKANTDDVRNAASLTIIPALQAAGAQVRAFDPEGIEEARKHLTGVMFTTDCYECASGANVLVILTDWDQFRMLDLDRIGAALRSPIVVDLCNLYSPAEMKARGFRYVSVGRPDVEPAFPSLLIPTWDHDVRFDRKESLLANNFDVMAFDVPDRQGIREILLDALRR